MIRASVRTCASGRAPFLGLFARRGFNALGVRPTLLGAPIPLRAAFASTPRPGVTQVGDGVEHERGYVVAAEDLPVPDELLRRLPPHPSLELLPRGFEVAE